MHARNALFSLPLAGDRRRRGPISWLTPAYCPLSCAAPRCTPLPFPSAGPLTRTRYSLVLPDCQWSATPIDAAGLAGLPPRFQLSGSGSLHPLKHRHCTAGCCQSASLLERAGATAPIGRSAWPVTNLRTPFAHLSSFKTSRFWAISIPASAAERDFLFLPSWTYRAVLSSCVLPVRLFISSLSSSRGCQ